MSIRVNGMCVETRRGVGAPATAAFVITAISVLLLVGTRLAQPHAQALCSAFRELSGNYHFTWMLVLGLA